MVRPYLQPIKDRLPPGRSHDEAVTEPTRGERQQTAADVFTFTRPHAVEPLKG
jgi:hypothetical protein